MCTTTGAKTMDGTSQGPYVVDDAAAAHRMKLKSNQTVLIPCAHWQTTSADNMMANECGSYLMAEPPNTRARTLELAPDIWLKTLGPGVYTGALPAAQ